MRCSSRSNCRRGSAKTSLLYISCDFLPVLWCPRICLTSALRPALPAQLSAVLFRQWMVVASGSCPRALNKILSSHFLASRVLVDLSVHCPSSVGAGNIGTWSKCSRGLSASLATLTNSKTRGFSLPPKRVLPKAWKALASVPTSLSCDCASYTLGSRLSYLLFLLCRLYGYTHNEGRTICSSSIMRTGNIQQRTCLL